MKRKFQTKKMIKGLALHAPLTIEKNLSQSNIQCFQATF